MRPEDVERFTIKGGALLGKETTPSDAEKVAHKTALSQVKVMRLKQEQVSSFESQSAQPQQEVRLGEASTAQLLDKMNEMHVELLLQIKKNKPASRYCSML